MAEEGKISWLASVDTSQLKRDTEKMGEMLSDAAKKASEAGEEADKAISKSGQSAKKVGEEMSAAIRRQSEEAKKSVKGVSSAVDTEMNGIKQSVSNAAKYIGAMFSVQALTSFARSIVSVRSEIESLEKSFQTLAGEQAGGALFSQIKQFATTTPMLMQDLAKGAQTLLAFNIPAEQVMDTLKQLGDISMGDSQKFNSLVLAFAQMSSAGKLAGQDLLQMINAGFNPLAEMATKTGKSIGALKDEMSKGNISVEMVKDAFASATSEGGKFYMMLEKQSQTISGALSNLQGAWDDMLNSMGEQTQGVLLDGIGAAQNAVQNWQEYVRVLMSVIAAYGTYKAVLMSALVIEKARNIGASVQLFMSLRKELGLATAAQQAFNITASVNPYVAIGTILATIVGLLVNFADRTDDVAEAHARLADSSSNTEAELKKENDKLKEQFAALENAKKGTDEWQKAKDDIVANYGQYLSGLDQELEKVDSLKSTYQKLTQAVSESIAERGLQSLQSANISALGADMDKALKSVQDGLKNASDAKRTQLLNEVRDYIINGTGMVEGTFVANLKKAGGSIWQDIYTARKRQTANLNAEAQYRERFNYYGTKSQNADVVITSDGENDEDNAGTTEWKNSMAKQQQAYIDLLDKQTIERVRASEDAEMEIEQARIDAMQKGSDKTLAQINLNLSRELKANERALEDYKSKQADDARQLWDADPTNNGKEWGGLGIHIDPNVVEANEAKATQITKKYTAERLDIYAQQLSAELASMNEYLAKYGTYEEKRTAIKAQYANKIAKAETEGERLSLSAEMTQALADLDAEGNKTTNAVAMMFADMTDKSIKELRRLAEQGEKALDFLSSGKYDASTAKELGITKEQFELWSKSPEKLAEIKNGLEQLRSAADGLETPLQSIASGLKKVFESGKNSKNLSDGLKSIMSGLQSLTQATSFVSQSMTSLGESLGSGALKGIGDVVGEIGNIAGSISSGAQAGAVFGPWGAAAGAALGAITSVAGAISKWIDASHEREIQRLQKQIDALSKSYDALSDAVEDAFSTDAAKMYQQQNALLKQQKLLIQKQIREEEDKKKTDNERIEQWKQQLEEIDKTIKENEEAAVNAIFGNDIKSAIEQFADAYAEAFAKGENRAKAAKYLVKDMIATMIKEAIKADFSAPMQRIRDALQAYFSDGIITNYESAAIEKMVEDAMADADKKYSWAAKYLTDSTDQSTTSKGFEAMSQDSADELNGRFASLQINTELIKLSVSEISLDTSHIRDGVGSVMLAVNDIRTMSMQALGYLESIVKNTKPIADISENIQKIEKNTRSL